MFRGYEEASKINQIREKYLSCVLPKILKWYPDKEYHTEIDLDKLSGYSLLIINDGHLIDKVLIDDLKKMFSGKIIVITDPFDVGGMIYARYPTVVESFTKLPTIQAYARHVYGFDSFMIDKHKSSLNEIKMQNRSIGKIDDKQYISNDPNMISSIREKQYKTSFRKNQKVIVTSKSGRKLYTSFSKTNVVLYNNSLMTIESSQINPWMTLRLYNSKDYVKCSLTYDKNPDDVNVNVPPANILTLDQYAHHKFKNTVFVYNKDYDLSIEYKYSILKNTNNLQLVMR